MNFGVGVPSVGPFADPQLLVDLAGDAEAGGWDGFFTWDHLLYVEPSPRAVEPWSVLAAAATVTRSIRLGVLVTALPRRPPALVAQQVATVDLLSGGRTIFGAGLGSRPHEFERFGQSADQEERGRRLDEALSLLEELWSADWVHHRGEFYVAEDVTLQPKPVQLPHPPIWIGGQWPNRAPFVRAAQFDGVVPIHAAHSHDSFMSPEQLVEVVLFVRSRRTREGPFEVAMEGMSRDASQLARLVPEYRQAGLTWWIEKLGWWRGDVRDAVARVREGPAR